MKTKTKRVRPGTSSAPERKQLFARLYNTNGGNATQAAIDAGYSQKTATTLGSRLLKDPHVRALVDAAAQKSVAVMERAGVIVGLTVERTLREIARIAYFDPVRLYNDNGTVKRIAELDEDTRAAIASIEVDEITLGGKTIGVTKKLRFHSKNTALDQAMKHLGQYEKDNAQQGSLLDLILAALKKRGESQQGGVIEGRSSAGQIEGPKP